MAQSKEYKHSRRMNALSYALIATIVLIPALALMYSYSFGPVEKRLQLNEGFVVSPDDTLLSIAEHLRDEGFIKNQWAFLFALQSAGGREQVRAGGYELSSSMDMWTIAEVLTHSPYLVWIEIPPGLRKEQIADRLQTALSWSGGERTRWITEDSLFSGDVPEGVYFPDTYLIPSDQPPEKVARRMQDRFRDEFAPYALEAAQKDVPWTDVLTIASMIEREAAGPHDMELIAGIIWNRLDNDMPLGIDATLQYIRGEEGNWWPTPRSEDKYLESPYNTYFTPGLPPAAIANPSLDSIKAVLNPEATTCLYYLHDYRGRIHCSPNYSGHVANIDRYLR